MPLRKSSFRRYALYSFQTRRIVRYAMLLQEKKTILNDAFKSKGSMLQWMSPSMAFTLERNSLPKEGALIGRPSQDFVQPDWINK